MSMNDELQRQIDELKKTVERLQIGETRYVSMVVRMRRVRKNALEKYYGNWKYFSNTNIQICPPEKTWTDYDYLESGTMRLTNIMYKHGRNLSNSKNIASAVETEADMQEYEEIANYITDCMVDKIKELRERHGIKPRNEKDLAEATAKVQNTNNNLCPYYRGF